MIGQELKYTAAMTASRRNLEGNIRGLSYRQTELTKEVTAHNLDLEWVFGRDGSLTALAGGAWWSGCSLPRRTAESLLKTMELKAAVICFLAPTHAAQVRVTLDRLAVGQALIAVVPDARDLRVLLSCENFEQEILDGRLWFASGERWGEKLERLLKDNDGLPLPGQFVRTILAEREELDEMIKTAQDIFSRETTRRSQVIRTMFDQRSALESDRVCVVAPSAFRLWEDVGGVVGGLARDGGWTTMDPDDPCQSSPVAFARLAAGCEVVVVVNTGRADLPADLPAQTKVVSWVTGPRLPRFDDKGAGDVLLVADERWRGMAISAGWPAERVSAAAWPTSRVENAGAGLGVIADTLTISTPEFGLSSQKILWESIARELADDPFAPGLDAGAYLARWLARAGIAEETVNRQLFIDGLIVPTYQQGLVRWLIEAGIDIKIFGKGWDEIEEFASRHAGEVRDRQGLSVAVESCAALVHVWPAAWAHPIEAAGRAVLRRGSKTREMWLAEARRMVREASCATSTNTPVLSIELIRRIAKLG